VSRLSGFPKGLLSLLGSNNFGTNPKELGETIAPVVDTTDYFALQLQVGAAAVAGAPAGGPNILFTVPAGEVWKVCVYSIFVATGGAATVGAAYTSASIGGATHILGAGVPLAINNSRWAVMSAEPFFLNAGESLGAYISELVGAITLSGSLLSQRFRT